MFINLLLFLCKLDDGVHYLPTTTVDVQYKNTVRSGTNLQNSMAPCLDDTQSTRDLTEMQVSTPSATFSVGRFYLSSIGQGIKRSLFNVNCASQVSKKPRLNTETPLSSQCVNVQIANVANVSVSARQGIKRACLDINRPTKVACVDDPCGTNTTVTSNHTATITSKTASSQTLQYISANTPRKVLLRKKLHTNAASADRRKSQLTALKKKHREKLASLCGARSDIERVIADVGKYLHGDALNFVAHQLRMTQHPPKGRRYSDEIRLLSLSLYNSSPKAYAYLAEIFILPSKISLLKWLRNVRSSPGFHEESFSALSERMKFMPERDRVCSLMIDEIHLKQNLQYDQHQDVIVGYEDLGGHYKRSKEHAGNALVFMLRGLCSRWNQPVGYVFTRTACKADVVQSLLYECLDKCEEAGCKVKVVISDQGPNFQCLANKLNIKASDPYFFHANRKYFYMFDPPHLLKSIRNNLHKYIFQFANTAGNKDEKPYNLANWEVIKQYYEIDKNQNFRLTPKLTDSHIYLPAFSKMKVKWAAQVLSRSVAAALETHSKVLGVNSKDTAEFISKFNNIFDAVNSSSLSNSNKMRTALSETSGHIEFLTNSVQWIKELKIFAESRVVAKKVGNKVVKYSVGNKEVTNTVKCLQGWQLTINCILQLWPLLKNEYNFNFLCTRHLNQDPLEQLFSVIRQKGGNCQHPTPYNFSRIYKNVTCQKLLKPVKSGNCELNVTEILGKLTTCKMPVRPSTKTYVNKHGKQVTNNNLQHLQQHCIIPSIQQWNVDKVKCLEDNALHYVCGYLMRKVKSWHDCEDCNNALIGGDGYAKHNETYTMLKKFTDTSKLINVSQSFHYFVLRCEKAIIKEFDINSYKPDIGSRLVECLKDVKVPSRCIGFPKHKFFILFVRVRIFYLLKFLNASFGTSKPKNKTKEFSHK